jgi:colanic acid/amylovoran biosynthesis protein
VVRILVDQSGYDLMNLGDVAMLQACVARLRLQWPDAEIMVIAHQPRQLALYCPGTIAIGRTFADARILSFTPRRARLAAEQAWKMAAPHFSARLRRGRPADRPRTAVQAVRAADLVVASGGGYLTDTWWWHAAGVLSLLSLAQRLGKPTAMFGQGIGPISQRKLRTQARSVLPNLAVLGLREDRMGRPLALSLGAVPGTVRLTGDDALELTSSIGQVGGYALGLNVRVSGYARVDQAAAGAVGELVLDAAAAVNAPVVGLPVSRYAADADAEALRVLASRRGVQAEVALDDLASPESLGSAVACCRAVVTGSYHAAVFGLALGVPVVCLTNSAYYDGKFGGLKALFPDACSVVSLDAPDLATRLRAAILAAWHMPDPLRAAARATAGRLRDAGRDAYAQFKVTVEDLETAHATRQQVIR